jgi:hypothetical protein
VVRVLDRITLGPRRRDGRNRRKRWQLPDGLVYLPERIAFLPDVLPLPPGRGAPVQDPYDADRLIAGRTGLSAPDRRRPSGVHRFSRRAGRLAARIGTLPEHGSPRIFAVVFRATAMVAVLSAMVIWIATAGNLTPGGVRFTGGTPTSQISAAGSVTEHPPAGSSQVQTSRSGPASSGPAGGTPAPTVALPAAGPCHISYSLLADVPARFTVVIVIANTSSAKVNGWTLRWDFPSKQEIIYGWNAIVNNGPGGAVATGIDGNQQIAPGESITIGFVGKRQGWVPTPTGFTLNGQACQWQPTAALSPSAASASSGSSSAATAVPSATADSAVTGASAGLPAVTVQSSSAATGNGNGGQVNGPGNGAANSTSKTTGG